MKKKNMSPTNTGNIGVPPSTSPNTTNAQKNFTPTHVKKAKVQFRNWLMGFVISIFPLLVIPVFEYMEKNNVCNSCLIFISNSELLFVGISIAVSAINDFIGNANDDYLSWTQANIVLVIGGTLLYTIMIIFDYIHPENTANNIFTYFPIIYLLISFVLGCIRYVKNIKN